MGPSVPFPLVTSFHSFLCQSYSWALKKLWTAVSERAPELIHHMDTCGNFIYSRRSVSEMLFKNHSQMLRNSVSSWVTGANFSRECWRMCADVNMSLWVLRGWSCLPQLMGPCYPTMKDAAQRHIWAEGAVRSTDTKQWFSVAWGKEGSRHEEHYLDTCTLRWMPW